MFTFSKYNKNHTVTIVGSITADIDARNFVYLYQGAVLQLKDTASVSNIRLLAEDAVTTDKFAVAYEINKDDILEGKVLDYKVVGSGLKIGTQLGIDNTNYSYLSNDATNKYFKLESIEDKYYETEIEKTLTIESGGATLSAGDKFSLSSDKTTKTLGAVVYVAAEDYASGTSLKVKVYNRNVKISLEI